MKSEDIEFIIKQTLIEASLHHEEDSRQRYYNGILELVNHYKYLENKMREVMDARYNDGVGRKK
jgi:hypothetical protein